MIGYKLTDHKMQTFDNFQWELNVARVPDPTEDKEGLCGPGWLHFYQDPLLGLLMNPAHAWFEKPRLFECLCEGDIIHKQLLSGCTQMTLLKEIEVPEITIEQRIKFAILCALEVYQEEKFVTWARKWLDGSDRSHESARAANVNASYVAAADAAHYAADAAARAATVHAADAAHYAADAAHYAADTATVLAADAAHYAADAAVYNAFKIIDFVKLAKQALES